MKHVLFDSQNVIPAKIICVGRNYLQHVEELKNQAPKEPVIFVKPNSAITDLISSQGRDSVDYEGEISFIFASGQIAGVGFGFDLTKRKVQRALQASGLPWERAKAFNGSAAFSPFVRFDNDCSKLRMVLFKNDVIVQQADYAQMLFKPQQLITDIKTFMSLDDGDILMTGTPKGVGGFIKGDKFVGQIYSNDALLVEHTWLAQ